MINKTFATMNMQRREQLAVVTDHGLLLLYS